MKHKLQQKTFLYLLIFLTSFPTFILSQDSSGIKWIRYSNDEFKFSIEIPENSEVKYTDALNLKLFIPNIQSSKLLERQEMEIFIIKSDTCCTNSKFAYGEYRLFENEEIIKVRFNNRDFYLEQDTDHAMGGAACIERYYATCRKSDNTCFIFYFQLFYHNKYDEATEGFTEPDFNFEVELETAYRILSSLDFPDMR